MAVERVREGAPPALHGDVVPDDQLAFAPMMRIQGTRIVQVPEQIVNEAFALGAGQLGHMAGVQLGHIQDRPGLQHLHRPTR